MRLRDGVHSIPRTFCKTRATGRTCFRTVRVARGVRNGVATIQTNRGMIEVAEGDTVPGLGRVRGIEKVDGRWMVFLRNGVIDAD